MITKEKEFLHNIATPIATAKFLLETIVDDLSNRQDANSSDVEMLKNISLALDKVTLLLSERRIIIQANDLK